MATVHGPIIAQHPTTFQAHNIPATPSCTSCGEQHYCSFCLLVSIMFNYQTRPATATVNSSRSILQYGHKSTARLCSQFITHHFACPEYPPTLLGSNTKLPHFIAYALHWTKLHTTVTFAVLVVPLTLHIRLHDHIRGNLQRNIFEQVVEYSWAGDVPAEGD